MKLNELAGRRFNYDCVGSTTDAGTTPTGYHRLTVRERVGGLPGRPLLGDSAEEIDALLTSREGLYREASDAVVETSGRDIGTIAGEVAALAEVA